MENMFFDIALLVGKYLADDLTLEEKECLEQWLNLSKENREWFDRITSEAYQSEKGVAAHKIDIEQGWQALQAKRAGKHNRIRKTRWLYAGSVAAALAILVGTVWLLKDNSRPLKNNPPSVELAEIKVPTLIETLGNNVILSYDSLEVKPSGRVYVADEKLRSGQIDEVGLVNVPVRYKTIVIPAGYTYQVQLADGSKVTLNAGSTLRFPEYFQDSLREVELTGEGYFEVAKSATPFVVKAGNTQVTVYGTRFNLFFSEKLQMSEAILLEGSIGMKADQKEVRIVPNQRVCHYLDSHVTQVNQVNAADHITWLENSFRYNNELLKRIVFDLGQWYGIEIALNPEVAKENYSLEFDKSVSVDWALQALEKIINKDIKKEGGVYYIK